MENNENIIVLSDENGQETQFEIVTVLEIEGKEYYVLYPVDSDEEDALVLKLDKNEEGEEILTTIEDDEEFDRVSEAYEEWLESDEADEYFGEDEQN